MGQGEDVSGDLSQGKVSRMGEEILPRKQHLYQVQKLLSLIGQGFFPTFTIRILLLLVFLNLSFANRRFECYDDLTAVLLRSKEQWCIWDR